ncbi:MAG: methyltransferase [Kiritimatiellia bacterium]
MKFKITDLTGRRVSNETFLNKTVTVESRSGLHAAEKALINRINSIPLSGNLLIVGNRTGVLAMIAATLQPDSHITCHTGDIHHAKTLCRNLQSNQFCTQLIFDDFVTVEESAELTEDSCPPSSAGAVITVACTTRIPKGEFDNAFFMITPTTTTGEHTLDLLENIHQRLKVKGKCLIAYAGESHALTKQLKDAFGQVQTIEQSRKGGTIFLATKKAELKKPRDFSATFEASLPGGNKITLGSLPGIFCHRRADNGGLALAEIAAERLEPGMRVLDMGCGCGIVGLLLAWKHPDIEVTFIDSHARAMDVTHRNIQSLGVAKTKLILSDTGTAERGYDMFVGNPPYYSDYRIAEIFIEQAYQSLKEDGVALFVTKQTAQVGYLIHEKFGNSDMINRRGYGVISAVR